jgi:site-specific recombinase XerD
MDPKKDAFRRCIAPDAWPESDRRAWENCLTPGDLLEVSGAGASWAPHTRAKIAKGYGRWLTWLSTKGLLDSAIAPGDRVDRQRVAAYVAELSLLNAPYTVVARVQELYLILTALAPEQDWTWIRRIERRLRTTARSVRNKRKRLVSSEQLFSFGLELMAQAESDAGGTPLQRAVRYRDGLMISLLAARPLRRRNFCSIEVGRHLICEGDTYWLRFGADETKNHSPIEAPVPLALTAMLEHYLTHYRPLLVERNGRWNRGVRAETATKQRLWVSEDGSAMTEIAIYFRIRRATKAKFGHVINPHLFRDSAATSIAVEDPESAHITRSILGHGTLRTSEQYYNHAQSREALRHYQRRILELRKRHTASAERLD